MKLKEITPSDYQGLKKYFHNQKYEICEYSLRSIIAWTNGIYRPYYALDDDTLIVCLKFSDSREEDDYLLLPLTSGEDYSPEKLHETASLLEIGHFCFVPDSYVEKFGRNRVESLFGITELEGHHDYVYLTEDLSGLKGNRYSKKRNLINQFKKGCVDRNRVEIETVKPLVSAECIDFLEKWCEEHDCDSNPENDLACEKQAAINILENIEMLEVKGILLRIDGKVSAFGIGSYLTENMGVLHFEKAYANVKGLYQYFDNECAKRLFAGYSYINKENDMNLPGLVRSKKSYYPVKTVRSNRLTVL